MTNSYLAARHALSGTFLCDMRYHQLDVVRKLIADVKASGSGKSYLIQHSAGSGKSNSIAWTAYNSHIHIFSHSK